MPYDVGGRLSPKRFGVFNGAAINFIVCHRFSLFIYKPERGIFVTAFLSIEYSTMKKLSRIFGGRPPPVIGDRNALASFIDGNSAFVAQTTLYGYIKTRAGLEYFRLFEEADFVASVNIAKWNIYATCVGDLTLFCGAHICNQTETECLADYLLECMELIFSRHGHPPDAGEDYLSLSQTACERIKTATDWHADERGLVKVLNPWFIGRRWPMGTSSMTPTSSKIPLYSNGKKRAISFAVRPIYRRWSRVLNNCPPKKAMFLRRFERLLEQVFVYIVNGFCDIAFQWEGKHAQRRITQ